MYLKFNIIKYIYMAAKNPQFKQEFQTFGYSTDL